MEDDATAVLVLALIGLVVATYVIIALLALAVVAAVLYGAFLLARWCYARVWVALEPWRIRRVERKRDAAIAEVVAIGEVADRRLLRLVQGDSLRVDGEARHA